MPNNVATPVAKRRKVPKAIRQPQILALQAAGLTQSEVARQMGVSRQSITRDMRDLAPARAQATDLLSKVNDHFEVLQSPEAIARNYVSLAETAKNESARIYAQDRIMEYRGVITDKERIRAKTQAESAVQPMFVLPAGTEVRLSVGPAKPQDVVNDAIDVTPKSTK